MDVRTFHRYTALEREHSAFTRRNVSRSYQSGHRRAIPGIAFFLTLTVLLVMCQLLEAATYATPNFVVSARSAELAQKVGETAEKCRVELARLWLGSEIPQWSRPCPIQVDARKNLGAGGETSFTFAEGEVFGWQMKVQGSEERILDSVIPHEVSHTILATYFRKPVPRWIDEGAATSIEALVERNNYRHMLIDFMKKGRAIPFNTMVRQKEYPQDQMPFYAQGFSVCEYLILVGGHRRLIEFTNLGLQSGDWSAAVKNYYGYDNLGDLQVRWQNWVSQWYLAGMPANLPDVERLAGFHGEETPQIAAATPSNSEPVIRGNQPGFRPSVKQEMGQLVPVAVSPNSVPITPVAPAFQSAPNQMAPTVATVASPATPLSEGVGSAVPPVDRQPITVTPLPVTDNSGMSIPQNGYQGSYGQGISNNPIPEQRGSGLSPQW